MRADLDRARQLAFAGNEEAAHALLMPLVPTIEEADRDDWMSAVFAQLGEIFLVRTAHDRAADCARQLDHVLTQYAAILAGTHPDPPAELTLTVPEIQAMIEQYAGWPPYLESGLAAARGDHDGARAALAALDAVPMTGHARERRHLMAHARIRCADALCEDDRYAAAIPLWEEVIAMVEESGDDDLWGDRLLVSAGLGYGRFCVETGRLAEAEPWLRRAGARAEARGWRLDAARSQLERGIIRWTDGDLIAADQLYVECYPVIAEHARAHEVSRVWYQRGLVALACGHLEMVEQCWDEAERHWREVDKSLQVHRLLLQRSWAPIFRSDFPAAVEYLAQAREVLDGWPRSTWVQYARLDFQLGMVWRADALADLGFDPQGELAVYSSRPGSRMHRRAMGKLEQAAELIVPAALAVDAERHAIADPAARARWATSISAPMYAGAFAIAHAWENTALIAELIEHHAVRGAFDTAEPEHGGPVPATTDLPFAVLPEHPGDMLTTSRRSVSLTRIGPAPALQMDPGAPPILRHYRELATSRYGRTITTDEPMWRTWP
ncbi:hypothetical protein RB608_22235 [Nocardioides sp. LHD-245]|uniref:hypothetical protein n=1 Tax=Nocardioides sp. LHD-245 TaxID=3051387 RepID=UPI0027DED203|nr:hypothetical protein [Nocardioides sp. LHD-245]